MSLLSSTYGAVVAAKNELYDRGWLRSSRLRGPVVSVGNLSVGGAGKTPFTILLGQLLLARGIKFDVLSRGYGRKTRGTALVDPTGSPTEFGDEPILIAKKLEVPVVVGESRYKAGQFAESKFGLQLHLLDDGFQHRALARDYDIVLVTPEDAHGQLLPTGRLRERLGAMNRADAVVLMKNANAAEFPIETQQVWRTNRGIALDAPPPRPLVFCGIARPEDFLHQLKSNGITPAAHRFFRDHHAYTKADIDGLLRLRDSNSADGFITTEKDAINLGELKAKLRPLSVAQVTMELESPDGTLNTILRVIAERKSGGVRESS